MLDSESKDWGIVLLRGNKFGSLKDFCYILKMSEKIYEYKDRKYRIFAESKMKVNGVWEECIIYQTLYVNKDGWIWVRTKKEFFDLFKEVE